MDFISNFEKKIGPFFTPFSCVIIWPNRQMAIWPKMADFFFTCFLDVFKLPKVELSHKNLKSYLNWLLKKILYHFFYIFPIYFIIFICGIFQFLKKFVLKSWKTDKAEFFLTLKINWYVKFILNHFWNIQL